MRAGGAACCWCWYTFDAWSPSSLEVGIIFVHDLVQVWAITAPSEPLFPMTWHSLTVLARLSLRQWALSCGLGIWWSPFMKDHNRARGSASALRGRRSSCELCLWKSGTGLPRRMFVFRILTEDIFEAHQPLVRAAPCSSCRSPRCSEAVPRLAARRRMSTTDPEPRLHCEGSGPRPRPLARWVGRKSAMWPAAARPASIIAFYTGAFCAHLNQGYLGCVSALPRAAVLTPLSGAVRTTVLTLLSGAV